MEIMTMRMARASEKDLDAGMTLLGILDALSRGYYPESEAQRAEGVDTPTFFDEDDTEHLQHLHRLLTELLDQAPGFAGRVIYGMCVVCDPKNGVIDQQDDCLEVSPAIKAAQADQARILAILESMGLSVDEWRAQADGLIAQSARAAEPVAA